MTDRAKHPRPTPLAEALTSYLQRSGLSKRIGQANVVEQWAELVGPQIAKVTTAESVTPDGVLLVRVATSMWASELSLMSPQILARLNSGRSGRITGIRWLGGGKAR
jgi:predicted nucleic acid-binding Zn ribbon protein